MASPLRSSRRRFILNSAGLLVPVALSRATVPFPLGFFKPASSAGSTDPDADDWIDRVIANSGTASVATQDAVNTLVLSLKAANLWTKIIRMNLFCGDQLAAALVPLKKDAGDTLDAIVGSNHTYSEANGIAQTQTGDPSKLEYITTGLNPSATSMGANDGHLSIYLAGTAGAETGVVPIGATAFGGNDMYLATSYATIGFAPDLWVSTGRPVVVDTDGRGFYIASRLSGANGVKAYRNGFLLGVSTSVGGSPPDALAGPNTKGLTVLGANVGPAGTENSIATTKYCRAYTMGLGLTESDAETLFTIIQHFQVTLNREHAVAAWTPTVDKLYGTPTISVALASRMSGASIYYTTDGSTPTTASTLYTGAISITSNPTTLKAIAAKTDYTDSAVMSMDYPGLVPTVHWMADSFSLSDGTAIGGTGNEWVDQTGGGNAATQSTAGARPLFKTNIFASGKPAIRFDGTDDFLDLTSALSLSGDYTIIAVLSNCTVDCMLMGHNSINNQVRINETGTNEIDLYDGTNNPRSTIFAVPNVLPRMITFQRTGSTPKYFENNAVDRSQAGSIGSITINLIAKYSAASLYLAADLGELLVYTSALTTTQIQRIYTNFMQPKYGLLAFT